MGFVPIAMVVEEKEANKKDLPKQKPSKLLPVMSVRECATTEDEEYYVPERAIPVAASPAEVYVDGGTSN